MSTLRGNVDTATRERIEGWVQDTDAPTHPVSLLLTVGDVLLARVLANQYRQDLAAAGVGNGRHSFVVRLDARLLPLGRCLVRIRREGDGLELPGSPAVLEQAAGLDATARGTIAALLETPCDDAELQARIAFLARQTERLMQRRAEHHSQLHERAALRRHRWRWSLTADDPAPDAPPHVPRRALVIDETMPVPGRDAGSHAILSHMQSLQRLGYQVTYVPADMAANADPACLEAIGVEACHAPWHASVEEVLRREAGGFEVVYLHRVNVAAAYTPLVRRTMPRAYLLYSVADLHHLRLERQAVAVDQVELRTLAGRVKAQELFAAWSADAVVTHSSHEAGLLRRHLPPDRVHVLPWVVPAQPVTEPFQARRGIAFLGGYAHLPNVDAAIWLVETIMPLVWQHDSGIECLLIGSAMPEAVRRLERPGIRPVGHVPDLGAVFGTIRLTVAPLTYGAGAKGKVLDSYAAGLPCVATRVAAEGLDLPDALAAWTADDPAALAGMIAHLHADAAANQACSEAALRYVAEALSEARVDALMRRALGKAAPLAA